MAGAAANPQYYDILLVGKTGSGKSTTGNKMLGLPQNPSDHCAHTIMQFVSKIPGLLRSTVGENKRFKQPEELSDASERHFSVTTQCEVLASETVQIKINDGNFRKLRILDVPGFADSKALAQGVSIYNGNLQIIRNIIRVQAGLGLKFQRIVYFLPCRGPLEKADGVLQEELKVMYYYFGKKIFECMVLAVTNHPNAIYQRIGPFDTEDTKSVFLDALRAATGDEKLPCPPTIYIGITSYPGRKIVDDVCAAPIQCEQGFQGLELQIRDDVCARCSVKVRHVTISNKKEERIGVVSDKGVTEAYETSKCHPAFKSKYAVATRVAGGVAHVLTLGLPYMRGKAMGKNTWPGFTNSDEICVLCELSPGAAGCIAVGQTVKITGGKEIAVHHTNKI